MVTGHVITIIVKEGALIIMKKITEFRGKYFFLSNFYDAKVEYNGLSFLNNESAFQAQKVLDSQTRNRFCTLPPNKAKSLGRHVTLREDWESVKDNIMYNIVLNKFSQNISLQERLLATGDSILIEGNTWNDTYWGVCNGVGKNMLGRILMGVRNKLKCVDK